MRARLLAVVAVLALPLVSPGALASSHAIVWEGTVRVDEPVHVAADEVLEVRAGTVVEGPAGVTVEGDLLVEGTRQAPVVWDTPLVVDGTNRSRAVVENASFPGRWGNVSDPLCTLHLEEASVRIQASRFENHSSAVCAGPGTDLVFRDNIVRLNGFQVYDRDHRDRFPTYEGCTGEDCPTGQTGETRAPEGDPGERGTCWEMRGDLFACRGWGGRMAIGLDYGSKALVEGNRFVDNHVALKVDSVDARIRNNTFQDNGAGVSVQANRWQVEQIEDEVRTGTPADLPGPGVTITNNTFTWHGDPGAGDWPAIPVGSAVTLFLGGATGPPPDPSDTQPDPPNATVRLVANTLREGGVGLEIQGWHYTALARDNTFLDNGVGVRGHSASAYLLDNTFHGHTWDLYADGYTGWLTATGGNLHEDKVHVAGEAVVETDWGLIGAGAGISIVALLAFLTEQGRYWLLRLLWVPLYSRLERSELLDQATREEVDAAIEDEPGIHLRELARRVDASYSTVLYHLRRLESAGLVRSERDGVKRRFYPVDARVPDGDAPTRDRVLAIVEAEPGIHQSAIARELDLSRQLVSYHLEQLETEGRVHREPDGSRNHVYPG